MALKGTEFAHRLKVARAEAQVTQKELAKLTGIHYTQIAKYETGNNVPNIDIARKLALALDCTIDSLVGLPNPEERREITRAQ